MSLALLKVYPATQPAKYPQWKTTLMDYDLN